MENLNRCKERINWDIMGPIYQQEVETLKLVITELNELIKKLSKENNQ